MRAGVIPITMDSHRPSSYPLNGIERTESNMKNPVGWFEIYVDDMGRAKTFYEAVFGIELQELEGAEFEMWAFPMVPEAYGAPGALVRLPGYKAGANSTIVYFTCIDCAVEAERARKSGGIIETPKKSIGPYGFISLVVDSEGNMIGLHSMK
jgi:predicted enzyme related to lactoylglutathione lyase